MNYIELIKRIAIENPDGNKAVGCVIVRDHKILSFGFRRTVIYSESPYSDRTIHAEQMAISTAQFDLTGATLFTTMEPCTQRPKGDGWEQEECCCDLILKAGIAKVVYIDTDIFIGRGGHDFLIKNGIKSIHFGD